MFDQSYFSMVAKSQFGPAIVISGVACTYFAALTTSWPKRLLAASPSLLLLAMAAISTIIGAMRVGFQNDGVPVVDAILTGAVPLLAISLMIFNAFFIKSKWHLLQIPNLGGGFFSWMVACMALSHDWL
jgi:hypothetical protein